MPVFSTQTARRIVSVSLEHELRRLLDVFTPERIFAPPLRQGELKNVNAGKASDKYWSELAAPGVKNMGESVLAELLSDDDFVDAMKVLLLSESNEKANLTSEEASQLLGFSRTYTNALLDSEEFEGKVVRTNGGHRRVSKQAIVDWKQLHGVSAGQDVKQARAAVKAEMVSEAVEASGVSTSKESAASESTVERKAKLQKMRERVAANRVERL